MLEESRLEVERVDLKALPPDQLLELDRKYEQAISTAQRLFREACRGPPKDNQGKESLAFIIKKTEEELKDAELNLKVEVRAVYLRQLERKFKLLEAHVECQKELKNEIDKTKRELKELTLEIRKLDKEELSLQQESLTDEEYKEILRKTQTAVEGYKSRLHASKLKEGEWFSSNQNLKSRIESLLSDRAIFHKEWNALIGELSNKKRYLIDLIERSTLALADQDHSIHVISQLNRVDTHNKAMYESEMKDMRRELSAIKDKHHAFLEVKGKRRELLPIEERHLRRRAEREQELSSAVETHWAIIDKILEKFSEEYRKDKSAPRVSQDLNKRESEGDPLPSPLELKQRVMQKKFGYLTQLIDEYKKRGDNFFQMFKYLTEIDGQVIPLAIEFQRTCDRIDQTRLNKKLEREARLKKGYELSTVLTKETKKTDKLSNELKKVERDLDSHMQMIDSIFNVLECDRTFLGSLIDEKSKVTQFNIKLFLSTLESKLNKVLGCIYFLDSFCGGKSRRLGTVKVKRKIKPIVPITRCVTVTQCSECAAQQEINQYREGPIRPKSLDKLKKYVEKKAVANDFSYRMHTLSKCHLPKSRVLVNKRFL